MDNFEEIIFDRTPKIPGKAIKLMVPEISDLLCMNIRFLITEISQIRVIIVFSDPARLPKLLDFEYECILLANYTWIREFGLTDISGLIQTYPHLHLLVYLRPQDIPRAVTLFHMGVQGCFSQEVSRTEFTRGLYRLARGESFYSQDVIFRLLSAKPVDGDEPRKQVKLTQLEQTLVTLLLKGHTNEDISRRLSITLVAVERIRQRLNRKFRINDCRELIHPGQQVPGFVPYEREFPHEPGSITQKYTVFLR